MIEIDQSPIGRSPRSNPATYAGFYDDIRSLFAATPLSVERGYTASRFSFNVKGGRCENCAGEGSVTTKLNFLPDVEALCPSCKGARYSAETLEILHEGKNIAEILALSIEEGASFFAHHKKIHHKLKTLSELGLGYLALGHPAPILSGGEAQRVKLATELGKLKRGAKNLYILDEPTTGLHLADIQKLLDCLMRLVEAGNTVLVIEHHLDVIKCADWVIDLGPKAAASTAASSDRSGHPRNRRRLQRIVHRPVSCAALKLSRAIMNHDRLHRFAACDETSRSSGAHAAGNICERSEVLSCGRSGIRAVNAYLVRLCFPFDLSRTRILGFPTWTMPTRKSSLLAPMQSDFPMKRCRFGEIRSASFKSTSISS